MENQPINVGGIEDISVVEHKISEVRRHPFGLVALYFQATAGVLLSLGLLYFLFNSVISEGESVNNAFGVAGVVFMALTGFILLLATYVYTQNKLIISDKNLTQVLQRGIFSRRISELSMANVEDVTADQHGIFQALFNFGELRVETAGEQNNFNFPYCPNPSHYGKIILDARQKYIDTEPEAAQRANVKLNTPGSHPNIIR